MPRRQKSIWPRCSPDGNLGAGHRPQPSMEATLNTRHTHSAPERGSVAIIVALSIAVLIGMIGLAVDLGRMFVIKTELQNAADACALAAANELDGNTGAKLRADAAGIWVSTGNKINFQHDAATDATVNLALTYSETLNGIYGRSIDDKNAKFAKCTLSRPKIGMLFMGVLGIGSQTVGAHAVASLVESQAPCTIPLGYCMGHPTPGQKCADGSDPDSNGLCIGNWSSGKFSAGSGDTVGETNINGAFNWLDFPNDEGTGANVLKDQLITGYCGGLTDETVDAETGDMSVLQTYWNTRFGLYKSGAGSPQYDVAPKATADLTGFSYTPKNWPSKHGAYSDFVSHRPLHTPYQGNNPLDPNATGLNLNPSFSSKPEALAAGAIDRRVVTVPIVDCNGWDSTHTTYSGSYACVLLLHPIAKPTDIVYMEYLGPAGPGSVLCPTGGLPGKGGAKVPGLVQ